MNENELYYGNTGEENRYNFHTIPMLKFFFMSWVTFGVWYLRWLYRMWQKVAVDYDYRVSPFWRSAFFYIFSFPLFKIIEKHANAHGIKFAISSTWLAILFILLCFLPVFDNIILDITTYVIAIAPAAYIQHKINEVNKKSYPDAYVEEWNIADTIWSIICIAFRIIVKIATKALEK